MGLGRDGTLHGTYEFRSWPFPLGRPVSRKAGKRNKTIKKIGKLLSKGGFRLTRWVSSFKKVIDSVPESEKAPSVKNLDLPKT